MWKNVKKISSSSSSSPLVESNVRLVRSDFLGHLDPIFPLSCLSNNTASTLENDFQEMQTISSAWLCPTTTCWYGRESISILWIKKRIVYFAVTRLIMDQELGNRSKVMIQDYYRNYTLLVGHNNGKVFWFGSFLKKLLILQSPLYQQSSPTRVDHIFK